MLPTLSPRSSRKRYDGTHGSIWMTPRAINRGPALPPPPAWTAAGASGPSRMRSAEACPVSQTRYAAAQGRQRLAAEGAQLVLRDCTAWLAHHHRRDHFLLPRVRHPDDIRLLDSGMGREKLLHFEWRDIDPPGRDPNFPVGMWKERRATTEGTMELTTQPESPMMLQR